METIEIEFKGILLSVSGTHEKGEEAVFYYADGSGFPGSSSSFEIEKIRVENSETDIFELFSFEDLIRLEEDIIEQMEG